MIICAVIYFNCRRNFHMALVVQIHWSMNIIRNIEKKFTLNYFYSSISKWLKFVVVDFVEMSFPYNRLNTLWGTEKFKYNDKKNLADKNVCCCPHFSSMYNGCVIWYISYTCIYTFYWHKSMCNCKQCKEITVYDE